MLCDILTFVLYEQSCSMGGTKKFKTTLFLIFQSYSIIWKPAVLKLKNCAHLESLFASSVVKNSNVKMHSD